jgi:hypothetical protein
MNSYTTEAVLADPGSVIVAEDDDVVFCLELCREVQRIYNLYLVHELTTTEGLWASLILVGQALEVLGGPVTDGMPAARLEVARAQIQEMDSVLFNAAAAFTGTGSGLGHPESSLSEVAAVAGAERPARRDGFWSSRPWPLRAGVGLVGCVAAAVIIDTPFTVMALYPNQVIPIGAGFVGVPLAVQQVLNFRSMSRRAGGRSHPEWGPLLYPNGPVAGRSDMSGLEGSKAPRDIS